MKKTLIFTLSFIILLQFGSCGKKQPDAKSASFARTTIPSSAVPPSSAETEAETATSETSGKINDATPAGGASGDIYTGKQTVPPQVQPTSPLYTSSKTGVYAEVPPASYYLFGQLTETGKAIYNKLLDSIYQLKTTVSLNMGTAADVRVAFLAMRNDNPLLFWIPQSMEMTTGSGIVRNITFPPYRINANERDIMLGKCNNIVNEALSTLRENMSQYERELALHDWLLARVSYAAEHERGENAYYAYGALAEGKAVCEGYARAFQLLLYKAGIENTLVNGAAAGAGHIWNMANIMGKWAHVDPTWNDTNNAGLHSYFNVSDQYIQFDHAIDPLYDSLDELQKSKGSSFNLPLPECNSMEMSYCGRNGTLINSYDDFNAAILRGIENSGMRVARRLEYSFGENYDRAFNVELLNGIVEIIGQYNRGKATGFQLTGSFSICGNAGGKGFAVTW